MATKHHERRVNALSYSHAKAIDATSDVTKLVNLRKRLRWADHLRRIGAERPRQKCLRARAIVGTRPSIGLAAGLTDSFASTLAGLVADKGGGSKFVAQLLTSNAQNGATKILMLGFMMMMFLG